MMKYPKEQMNGMGKKHARIPLEGEATRVLDTFLIIAIFELFECA